MRNAIIGLVCSLATYSASATPIIYDFTGTVTELNSSGADQSGIAYGMNISGWLAYDPEDIELIPSVGMTHGGVPAYSIHVGPRTITAGTQYTTSWNVDEQRFEDILPRTDNDSLFWIDDVYWPFVGLDAGFPPNLDSFDASSIWFMIMSRSVPGSGLNFSGGANVTSTIDTWQRRATVPEPATLGLLSVGLLGVAAARRRSGRARMPA